MGKNKKINISIVVISTITTFLQTLIISIESIYKNIIIQIVSAILNAIIVALQSLQLNIKRINSFAKTQNVLPSIVIGRIQNDIKDYTFMSSYKDKYKWI